MTKTKLYRVWNSMVMRCHNKNSIAYKYYGARGIRVCKRWRKFENFFEDMGAPDSGLQLGRKNNDKGYTPSNVRWETSRENQRNKSTSRKLTYSGRTMCLCDWAEELGVTMSFIKNRIDRLGWSVERALTKPNSNRGFSEENFNKAKEAIAAFRKNNKTP